MVVFSKPYSIGIFGEFNAGKSSFINSILGKSIQAVDIQPTTAEITVIKHIGSKKSQRLQYQPGMQTIAMASDWLKWDVELWDTPGWNAEDPEHTRLAELAVGGVDIAIYIVDATKGIHKSDVENFIFITSLLLEKDTVNSFLILSHYDRNCFDEPEDEDDLINDVLKYFPVEKQNLFRIDNRDLHKFDGVQLRLQMNRMIVDNRKAQIYKDVKQSITHPVLQAVARQEDWKAMVDKELISKPLEKIINAWDELCIVARADKRKAEVTAVTGYIKENIINVLAYYKYLRLSVNNYWFGWKSGVLALNTIGVYHFKIPSFVKKNLNYFVLLMFGGITLFEIFVFPFISGIGAIASFGGILFFIAGGLFVLYIVASCFAYIVIVLSVIGLIDLYWMISAIIGHLIAHRLAEFILSIYCFFLVLVSPLKVSTIKTRLNAVKASYMMRVGLLVDEDMVLSKSVTNQNYEFSRSPNYMLLAVVSPILILILIGGGPYFIRHIEHVLSAVNWTVVKPEAVVEVNSTTIELPVKKSQPLVVPNRIPTPPSIQTIENTPLITPPPTLIPPEEVQSKDPVLQIDTVSSPVEVQSVIPVPTATAHEWNTIKPKLGDPWASSQYKRELLASKLAIWKRELAIQDINGAGSQPFIAEAEAWLKEATTANDGLAQYVSGSRSATTPSLSQLRSTTTGSLALIPPGTFVMGEDTESVGGIHNVRIRSGFYMMNHEVTQREWEEIMGSNPSVARYKGYSLVGNDLPVQNVGWLEVIDYANRLSLKEGLEPAYTVDKKRVNWKQSSNGYRLPTEAEWEWAATDAALTAASDDSMCVYGNVSNPASASQFNWNWTVFFCEDNYLLVAPVMKFKSNKNHIYDMIGNVWEWVWDFYGPYSVETVTNPVGPITSDYRVMRGGAWIDEPDLTTPSHRFQVSPDARFNNLGFRLVRSAP